MIAEEPKADSAPITAPAAPEVDQTLLDAMVKAGVLYGRKKAKTHPRMHPYIYTTRSGMEIIDIVQTIGCIDRAAEFLAGILAKQGIVLFVGTTPSARELVRAMAERFNAPYVTQRWLGGTLTNFKTLNQRLQHYLKLRSDRDTGKLGKYTKRERTDFDKEIERLSVLFGGVEKLTTPPHALVIVGATSHATALREARRIGIPVVAIASTDANPDPIDYVIPASDRSRSSIAWVLARLEQAINDRLSAPAPSGNA
mgnify:CR=1 FL=1